jgi:RimJ/RimL family protein N-acetyltransferase
MLHLSSPLYDGELIRLTPIDHQRDPEIVSRWSHSGEFMRMISLDPIRPKTVDQVKKDFERTDKQMGEQKDLFHFAIRTKADDRLIGLARLQWIEWRNGVAWISMGIADPSDRRKGFGQEALSLLMRFAFRELGLHRLSVSLPEYNVAALCFFEKAGFIREVRRRQAVNRGGRRWDLITLGVLRQEWEAQFVRDK